MAEELPVETFFRNYEYRDAKISPNGDYLAALAPDGPRVGLAIVDLKALKANWAAQPRVANEGSPGVRQIDVSSFVWLNDDRLLFYVSEDGYAEGGLFAVNRDGTKLRALVAFHQVHTQILDLLGGTSKEILVESAAYAETRAGNRLPYPHVARMNVFTGYMTREVTNPGNVVGWLTDHAGVVRVGMAVKDRTTRIIHRATAKAPWETLAEYDYDQDGMVPVAFASDNRTLYVACYGEEDTVGLYAYDTEKKALKDLLFRHKEVDAQSISLDDQTQRLVGVHLETDRPVDFWVDPIYAKQQAAVDQALPGTANSRINSSRDGSKVIFQTFSDRTPGAYYLLHTASNKLEKLFDSSERIKAEQMAEMKPVQYRSRDGLVIHGYLTLPLGSSGKNLPLIVNPHGGPWVRDSWTFDPEVQFFANRGYVVLQMNFRGSSGYGKSFLKAGYKQWGRKMQDDITDGVKWAIDQGIADPKRIAIYGASYGGYAALVGLEFTPELYRCGISYAGVTDVPDLIKSSEKRASFRAVIRLFAAEAIGDLKADKALLNEVSPQNHVDKIQAPVLLAYGELDPRVPISQGRSLARELKKQGKKFELIVKPDEGHGFHKEENKVEFYRKVDEFLKANLK